MAEYSIKEGQTLFDVALLLYGDVTKVVDLCKDNSSIIPSILTKNIAGLTVSYTIQNNETTTRFATNNISFGTRYPEITKGKAFSNGFNKGFN